MNTYRYSFAATCPSDGETIIYSLEIRSAKTIMVEHIKTAIALHNKGFQERIADDLHERFGGLQVMRGVHQGVEIETVRGGDDPKHKIEPMQDSCYCDLMRTTCAYCKSMRGDE